MRIVAGLLVALALFCGPASIAQRTRPDGALVLQFSDSPLSDIVREVGGMTGERFVFDPEALGKRVTLHSPQRVTREEAIELLNAALFLHGFAALPTPEGFHQIVEINAAPGSSPWTLESPEDEREGQIATLIHLQFADAASISEPLSSLLGGSGVVALYPPTNSLIVAGPEDRIRRILGVARVLDQASEEELIVLLLRYASAERVAGLLSDSIGSRPGSGGEVWSDDRTNRLIVRAPPADLAWIRTFVEKLDRPADTSGSLRVIRLRHKDPERVAELLGALSQGGELPGAVAPPTPADEIAAGDVDLEPAVELSSTLRGRRFTVVADEPTNSLVLSADPDTQGLLAEIVEALDRPAHRIAIEVTVWEVSHDDSLKVGVEWFTPLTVPKSPTDLVAALLVDPDGGGLRQEPDTYFFSRFTRSPLIIPFVDAAGNLVELILPRESAVLAAEAREVRFRVLMRPYLVMMSGEENEIFAGENVPIPVARTAPAATQPQVQTPTDPVVTGRDPSLRITQNIEREDVGVTLRVRPTVGESGVVILDLDVEESSVTQSIAGPTEVVGPTLLLRQVESTIRLRDGELAVIGAIEEEQYEREVSAIPWLGSIPALGWLFRAEGTKTFKRHIVIAAQARILRTASDDVAESIRRRLALERTLARIETIEHPKDAPFGVLLATRSRRDDAVAIAESFALKGHDTRVSAWSGPRGSRFDVYLVGYETFADASDVSLSVQAAGWAPEIVVLDAEAYARF